METLWQDLRYGARQLARHAGFTAAAVVTLALGIGTSTAVFGLVDALFLQQLHGTAQLVSIHEVRAGKDGDDPLSYADYLYYRAHGRAFSDLVAHYGSSPLHLVVDGEPSAVNGSVVTATYFRLLELTPALGRFFLEEEDRVPDRDAVAVISHDLWRSRWSRHPGVVGTTIALNGAPFTIVGVAPEGFRGLPGALASDVWIPTAMLHVGYRYCDAFQRGCTIVRLIGRLQPSRTPAEAQSELDVLAEHLRTSYPDTNEGRGIVVRPVRGTHPGDEEARAVTLLSAAVALVVLIVCANLAGLLLARGVTRHKEVAVRLALGAGRARLVRQLLTESAMLALLGGAAGLLIARWVRDLLLTFFGVSYRGDPINVALRLDGTALAFALALSLLTAALFGLLPALQASRTAVAPALKDEGPSGGYRRSRMRDGLVVVQIGVSLVLLVGAVLLVQSLRNVYRSPGFEPSQVVLLRLRPSLVGYGLEKGWAFQREVIRRLQSLPDVHSASPAQFLPLRDWGGEMSVWLPGREPARREDAFQVKHNVVGPRYFETLGVPLLEGRDFEDRDRPGTPAVAIVNETLARRLWPSGNASGQSLVADGNRYEIVGVTRDAHATQAPVPFVYVSYWQQDLGSGSNDSRTHVRVVGEPAATLPLLRREIAAVDPNVPINDYPLTERMGYEFRQLRAVSTALGCFGALAVFLTAVGLYGVLALAVAQRRRELAIRMALGAEGRDVAWLVMRHALSLSLIGTGAGLVAALASSRVLASLLFGVGAMDAVTFLALPPTLIGVALLASYLPARRATQVDPMTALRCDQ